MGLGCNYVLLDAQTIQMVKVDEAKGNKGSLGRQFVMQAVAQVRDKWPIFFNMGQSRPLLLYFRLSIHS